ncbi:MAG: biopolymer transporter ExbD [Acidobacteria bacterium]|nr:biopolymer transporter ExbD [Acidobacteriota bacterium]MDW7983625.1 biopolymer transporter ExbD [Acidobacteriota bacterium]
MPSVFKRWRSEPLEVTSDPNVIPLIDVTLVLLIIFMVITPMLQVGAAVQLPMTTHPEEIKREEKQLTVSLRHDLSVYIGDTRYATLYGDLSKFEAKMKELNARNPGRQVLIKADRRVKYGDVRNLMKSVQASGFANVGLIVDKSRRS